MLDRISASSLRVGFDTLRANPLRTLLSTLGIIMGVAALVSVLSLGDEKSPTAILFPSGEIFI